MDGPGSSKVSSRHFSSDFSLAIVVTLLLANYGQASQALVVWAHVEGAVALWITAGLSLGFPPVAFDIKHAVQLIPDSGAEVDYLLVTAIPVWLRSENEIPPDAGGDLFQLCNSPLCPFLGCLHIFENLHCVDVGLPDAFAFLFGLLQLLAQLLKFSEPATVPVRHFNSPVSAVRAAAGVGAHGVLVA